MDKVTVEVEAVTPIFIAGADQTNIGNEGLRPPSLRGQMRWWFRASAGALIRSPKKLRDTENTFFGSTEEKSKFRITSEILSPHLSKRYSRKRDFPQLQYLLFSMRETKTLPAREYYIPGSRFRLTFTAETEEAFKICMSSFWLLCYLGSVGSRSRKGFGSLKIVKTNLQNDEVVLDNKNTLKMIKDAEINYVDFLRQNLRNLRIFIKSLVKAYGSQDLPQHSIVEPEYLKIYTKEVVEGGWEKALVEVASLYRDFRKRFIDRNLSRKIGFLKDIRDKEVFNERRVFLGLPLNYYFPRRHGWKDVEASLTVKVRSFEKNFERRASPIFFGVYTYGKECYMRAIVSKSLFLPESPEYFEIEAENREKKTYKIRIQNQDAFLTICSDFEKELTSKGWIKLTGWE